MGLFDDIAVAKPGSLFDDIPAVKPGVAEDVAKSAVGGIVRGTAALPGVPGTILDLLDRGAAEAARQTAGRVRTAIDTGGQSFAAPAERAAPPPAWSPQAVLPTSEQTIKAAEGVIGPTYQPQTEAGKWIAPVAEFLPAVAAGPGGVGSKLVAAAVPAVASEAAGRATAGGPLEAPARVGAALIGGGAVAAAQRPTMVQRQVGEAMRGVDDATLANAGRLMEDASTVGVPLTWPEAVQHASNGATRLPDLQRVVEQSRTGGPELRGFYAERPGQVETAGRAQMDAIAPSPVDPVNTGLRVQKAASDKLNAARSIANVEPQPSGTLALPAELAERPAVSRALQKAADTAANEGAALPTIVRDETGKALPGGAAEAFAAGSRGRIDAAVSDLLGEGGALRQADHIVAQRAAEAGPLYTAARSADVPVTDELVNLLPRLKKAGALGQATQKMAIDGQAFDIGKIGAWDYMKRTLDDKINAAARKGANDDVRIFTGLKKELTSGLDAAVPEYAQARAVFAGHSEMLDALEQGKTIFGPGMSREAVQRTYAGLTPGEQEMFRLGAANSLREKLANASDTANLPHVVAGNQAIRDKLEAITPPDKLANFGQTLNAEGKTFQEATAYDPQSWRRAYRTLEHEGSPAAPDVRRVLEQDPNFRRGLALSDRLERTMVQPLEASPTGDLARKTDVVEQARALFPQNPASNSDAIISQTVRNIVRRDPQAAESLVRQHAETVFNEATQANMGGPNQWGGAKFASVIAGNPQQARNLEASVRALPNGQTRWDGFERFLDVMEATGRRLPAGSPTAPILETQRELARGGLKGEAAALALGGGVKLPHRLYEASQRYFSGRANAEMAALFTDPQALPIFQRLLREPVNSSRAQALALRLTFLGSTADKSSQPIP